jgi:hypothetical protein
VNPSFTPPQVQHAGDAGGAHLVTPRDAVQRTSTSSSRPAHGDFELDPTCGLNPHGTMTTAELPAHDPASGFSMVLSLAFSSHRRTRSRRAQQPLAALAARRPAPGLCAI